MTSIVLALAAAVAWGVSDFLGGFLSRRVALATVMLISQVVGFSLLLMLAALRGPSALDLAGAGFAIAASLAGLIGIAALYRGMAVGVVSIVAPISATGAGIPVVFGVLLGERASQLQAIGMGLALVGVVLASRAAGDTRHSSAPTIARGTGMAILAALGFGGFFILVRQASTQDVLWAGVVQRLTGVVIVGGLALVLRPSLAIGWRRLPGAIVVGVLDTSANVLYAVASAFGLVSLAAVLASLFPVVTVILARFVLHERLTSTQATGVACALAGVALIAWP